MVVKTMLFTNQSIDVVTIPLKPITKVQISSESSQSLKEMEPVGLTATKEQCEQLLIEAQQKKELILKEAEQEIEQIKKEAYNEAYQLGYDHGQEQGFNLGKQESLDEARQSMNELKEYCFKIQTEAEQYMDEIVLDLVQLTKKVVEKITFQVIEDSSTTILPLLQNQLKDISRRKQIFIRLNPDCYDNVQSQVSQLQQYCPKSQLHLVPDVTLTSYGCVIETESEIIDLQLDKQLNNLFQEFERLVHEL